MSLPPAQGFDLLVLGDLNPDIVVVDPALAPVFGQVETIVDAVRLTVGGSAGIMACGAARLGLSVRVCGVVGDDELGRWMLGALEARGVDTRYRLVDPTVPTGASVVLARGGDRAILTALGTIDRLQTTRVPPAALAGPRHIHAASTALQQALRRGLPDVFRAARSRGATTSFDANWDPAERWDDLDGLLSTADICFPNLTEAQRWTGEREPETAARALSARAAARREPAAGPLLVALKLGADGAIVVRGDETIRARAIPVAVVDTIGAGDSFDAGFLAATLAGSTLDDALRLAVACGSASTRAVGGVDGQPTMSEARSLLG